MNAEFAEIVSRLNRDQIGMSWSLPLEDGASALVPVVRVKDWLPCVALALGSEEGRAAVARHYTSVKAVLECAPIVASFANLHTGRGITASQATMAERCPYSDKTIRKILYVLRDLGLAKPMETGRPLSRIEIEAARAHHGGFQAYAASVWHLTVLRPLATPEHPTTHPLTPRRKSASLGKLARGAHIAAAAAVSSSSSSTASSAVEDRDDRSGHLSSRTSVREESPVTNSTSVPEKSCAAKKSPTRARAHARLGRNSKKGKKSRSDTDPRPLHQQHAAAQLVTRIVVDVRRGRRVTLDQWMLEHGIHIGAVSDVLAAVGIDTSRWNGLDIKAHIDVAAHQQGMDWPDRINNPLRFLQARLARLDFTEPSPSQTNARPLAPRTRVVEPCRRGDDSSTTEVRDGVENTAYQQWRAAADRRHPRLAKQARLARTTTCRPARESGSHGPETPSRAPIHPHGPNRAATGHTDRIQSAETIHAEQLPDELAAAVDGLCVMCRKTQGVVRESMSSHSLVCDSCWNSHGFAAVPAPAAAAEPAAAINAPAAQPSATAGRRPSPRRPWTAQRSRKFLTDLIGSPESPRRGPDPAVQRAEHAPRRRHPHPNCTLCRGDGWVLDLAGEPIEPAVPCICPSHPVTDTPTCIHD
ncbi:hypothetical protein [Nocardia amamiensis]|uniref:hypothetical protein n=1 Tax=Nocardia amamiensis TaxID=404578 RepID=UPI00082C6CFF|nr:hypothetical protein [Nocardia amamiensis]